MRIKSRWTVSQFNVGICCWGWGGYELHGGGLRSPSAFLVKWLDIQQVCRLKSLVSIWESGLNSCRSVHGRWVTLGRTNSEVSTGLRVPCLFMERNTRNNGFVRNIKQNLCSLFKIRRPVLFGRWSSSWYATFSIAVFLLHCLHQISPNKRWFFHFSSVDLFLCLVQEQQWFLGCDIVAFHVYAWYSSMCVSSWQSFLLNPPTDPLLQIMF